MDDVLRRLERDRDAGDVDAGLRWSAERRRRGMCGLARCEVGLRVEMTEHRSELTWGSALRPKWTWSLDTIEDAPGYPKALVALLNSTNPHSLMHGFGPAYFVFRETPFGALAFGPCHECEAGVRDPQDIVIDPGPRWGSRVPLWIRRGGDFAASVERCSKPPHEGFIVSYRDPRDDGLEFVGRNARPREFRRIEHRARWEEWRCNVILEQNERTALYCGSRNAGRVVIDGDPTTAAPHVRCPACGGRGPTFHLPYGGASRALLRPRPTPPPSPSPPARSGS